MKHWVFDVTEAVARARARADDEAKARATAKAKAKNVAAAAIGDAAKVSVRVEYTAAVKGHPDVPALGKVAEGAGRPAILMESYLVFSSS